ncbi:LLM class flavin-dependent oxidoreductase [Kribbella solani]|uniref:LLM class flavin-dependent oxidoreductase n=1 Tax=Kribbella solani TaxID=236067 RepID=UPI0029B24297|nr:LLM class flavin-dependent oxidoreductase [Kribbella solani]MDX2969810.1 LLM class flavin-dependent oxidoreductase [Kribbella solani]MDX3001539.1 LLM class flavin-dependent oxidoreductase [Kribbella solani]
MKIGVMLPLGAGDGADGGMPGWQDVRAVAEAAEQNGLDSVWLADHFLYRDPAGQTYGMHDSWTLLSALAAVTSRVELGNMVLCASFRDPGLTAKMAATLDEVSGGRLTLGAGAGWHDPEYETFGLPTDHRVGRFAEWLEIVARLVRGETVTYEGTYYSVREANLDPAPPHRIPILVAGRRPRMMQLTAQWADSWNTAWYGAPNATVEERLETLRQAVETTGKPAGSVAATVGIIVRDPDQPVHDPSSQSLAVQDLPEAITAYQNLGVQHLIISPEPMTPRTVELIAKAKQSQAT